MHRYDCPQVLHFIRGSQGLVELHRSCSSFPSSQTCSELAAQASGSKAPTTVMTVVSTAAQYSIDS